MEQLTVKDRICHYKTKYHMTNRDLAKRLDISESTLKNYMRDPDAITYRVMKKMCRLFGCSVEYLLEGR